jgi:hypothetical protein
MPPFSVFHESAPRPLPYERESPHGADFELADTDPDIFIPDAVEAMSRDADGSLHVVAAGSIRCKECGKPHVNEVPFCSSLCRMRHEERTREDAA